MITHTSFNVTDVGDILTRNIPIQNPRQRYFAVNFEEVPKLSKILSTQRKDRPMPVHAYGYPTSIGKVIGVVIVNSSQAYVLLEFFHDKCLLELEGVKLSASYQKVGDYEPQTPDDVIHNEITRFYFRFTEEGFRLCHRK